MDNPCSINLMSDDIVPTLTEHDTTLTSTQAAYINTDLVLLFETINNKTTTEFNKLRERINIDTHLLDDQYLVDPETMVVSDDIKEECNTDDFMVQLDQKLTDLSEHLKYARTNGNLSFLSSEEEFRESLRTIGNDINSARCNIHINYDISTNGECDLSSDFVGVDGDYIWELRRIFVVVRDIQRYTTFLIQLYQSTSTY